MKLKFFTISFLIFQTVISQIPVKANFFRAKEWSKSIALYNAKSFVLNSILSPANELVKFEIDALAASTSGELTSLVYNCDSKNKEGLVLGFFSENWNNEGVIYTGYAFKNFPKVKALALLDKIIKTINDNYKYLEQDRDNNNISFQDDDMIFLIYNISGNSTKIRIFWNNFDSEWDATSLYKTQKKLQKKLN